MESRLFLRPVRLVCSPVLPIHNQPAMRGSSSHVSTTSRRAGRFAFALLPLALFCAARPASAQQDASQYWPPDEPGNAPYAAAQGQYGGAPQQYPQAQQNGYGQQSYPAQQSYPQQAYAGQPELIGQQGYGQQLGAMQPLSPDQLTQLVAPIALYPDALVAQILTASTYPAQVSAADQWRRSIGNAPADQIVAGANAQTSWDPSVKALTAFPQVLGMLDQNLQWTTALGNAYYNQPQDVLQTIQVMRERAEQAGTLQNSPQEQITENQGYIGIAPTDPNTVYVPNYDPWQAYGQPVDPYPGFNLLGALGEAAEWVGSGFMRFGPGIAMSAFMTTPWGWLGWGLDWLAHAILFDHGDYWTHSESVRDWGFRYGGPRWAGGRGWDRGRDWGRGRDGYGYGHDRGGDWGRGRNGYGSGRDGYNRAFGRDNSNNGRGYGFGRPVGGPRQGFGAGDARTNGAFNNGGRGYSFGRPEGGPRQAYGYGDARTNEGFNRGFPAREGITGRPSMPTQQAFNRYPQAIGRPQQFGGARQEQFGRGQSYYGGGLSSPSHENYVGRQGFSNPSQGYRMPQNNYRSGMEARSYGGGYGNSFGGSQRSSGGGFHMFGGGHNSGGYSAPKSYGGGHSFFGGGGGHSYSGGGGHSFSGGGGHSFGGGGGHSFGGGGHSGGGHSGGGHSGGGHSGGGGGHSGGGGHHH